MKLSDQIAQSILEIMREADGIAEIQRNELAGRLGCVPSQINYVITSRFTPEQGYIVESRRGGGGYIRIIRSKASGSAYIMHIVNALGPCLDEASARAILTNLAADHVLSREVLQLIATAVSANALRSVPVQIRDMVRCDLFKQLLITAREGVK